MPKARYGIMRPYLGERGRLAHRMMTQTASIQVAFDYSDPEDWRSKFKAAALHHAGRRGAVRQLVPDRRRRERLPLLPPDDLARDRPARCGLPASVFEPGFGMETWLDWVLDVPTIFRHRARGLVPAGGVPFRDLLGADRLRRHEAGRLGDPPVDDLHRRALLRLHRGAQRRPAAGRALLRRAVFWTGLLYHDDVLDAGAGAGLRAATTCRLVRGDGIRGAAGPGGPRRRAGRWPSWPANCWPCRAAGFSTAPPARATERPRRGCWTDWPRTTASTLRAEAGFAASAQRLESAVPT